MHSASGCQALVSRIFFVPMKVLLIGGTGVLGRSFCRLAVQRGYQVTALARTADKAELLHGYGVETVPGSILDADSVRAALPGHEVVLNFASAVPRKLKPSSADWNLNDLVRIQGATNVLESLLPGDIFYCQAGLIFVYGDHRGEWVDEASAVHPNRFTGSARVTEEKFFNSSHPGLKGVSFRFSLFYHEDAWHTQAMVYEMRKRRFPVLGDGEYFWNLVHVEDAAAAVLVAIENQQAIKGREIINVADERPVLCREFLDHLARLLQVHPPTRIPIFVARLALGSDTVDSVTASFRCRCDRIRELGWKPAFPTFFEGLPAVLQFI